MYCHDYGRHAFSHLGRRGRKKNPHHSCNTYTCCSRGSTGSTLSPRMMWWSLGLCRLVALLDGGLVLDTPVLLCWSMWGSVERSQSPPSNCTKNTDNNRHHFQSNQKNRRPHFQRKTSWKKKTPISTVKIYKN